MKKFVNMEMYQQFIYDDTVWMKFGDAAMVVETDKPYSYELGSCVEMAHMPLFKFEQV